MLVAADETNAPEVTYPLDVQGWHRISIGVQERWDEVSIQVKLAGRPGVLRAHRAGRGPAARFHDV